MALQAASTLPSTFSIHEEAKSNAYFKETSFFGVSVPASSKLKAEFNCSAIRSKEFRKREIPGGRIRAQTATSIRTIDEAATEAKKTLRKGNVIITGVSSGLGLVTAKALAETRGQWNVVMACRNFLKAEKAAKSAAVYLPAAKDPTFTADGFELSVGTNHRGHFLLARLLLDDLKQSDYPSKRVIIVGSITGNTNTLAGNVPQKANLGDLRGLAGGLDGRNSSPMIDGGEFDGAKAYKDSKVCHMLMMQEFHRRYHEETVTTFASLYPGCIAETGLFREHVPLFRLLFPPFQKYITKGYVAEEDAGKRLAQLEQGLRFIRKPAIKRSE